MEFKVQPFEDKYQPEVIELAKRVYIGEFNISLDEAYWKELRSISSSFQKEKGNYWVALLDGKVIGTIAALDVGHQAFELREVCLDKEYRGKPQGYAKEMLETVIAWSKENDVKTIYLGTTLAFRAAHRFYEKNGFHEIARNEMPPYCTLMDCDEKFYQLDL